MSEPDEMMLTVQADDVGPLQRAVDAGDHAVLEGCELSVADRSASLGMASGTEMLTLAIAFSGNVAAGLVASWIFDRLRGSSSQGSVDANQVVVIVGDDVAGDADELEIIIRRKRAR